MTTTFSKGSFEFIEAKIRRDAQGTEFGFDFERLCKWFLKTSPTYRNQLDKVWLWRDWPDRWSGDETGIDLVARTIDGDLWAIQAKAYHHSSTISKGEVDKFLSDSNRRQFSYRLLIATTDRIGRNAQKTIDGQEKPVGCILRGDLLTAEVRWPTSIGGSPKQRQRFQPRPHQSAAIRDVVRGFQDHDRGKLIMACGTGKTCTALWIAEKLQSRRTLLLVPSLSLVQQCLAEWSRNATHPFQYLVVCSDDTVVRRGQDVALHSTSELGIPVTTDPDQIRTFLNRRHHNQPAVVFATYQSSDRIAAAQQAPRTAQFDLAICDEAHRCTGHTGGLFATVLDRRKIKARKRLFMTATPRYFTERVKQRSHELEYALASMDDEKVFGPQFHELSFHDAINANPPLLTDYQVVVIGVTDREAQTLADEAHLVRTAGGLETDARTLAAQIGLAKAMRKYDLQKIITFHSSVAKAERFTDPNLPDSLPGVLRHLSRSSRPTGRLWTSHISGKTPAGRRATLLARFGDLPAGTRGILSNCQCLGEGVDVPVLDGVSFIDPKRSTIDIIQAVGRVMRRAPNKTIGTIVIPVFVDEHEDADELLSKSAFESVWRVLRALRAHDHRLAAELDELRLKLGQRSSNSRKIRLPDRIKFDLFRLLPEGFEQAFYVRTVERTTVRQFRQFREARDFVHTLGLKHYVEWTKYYKGELPDKPPKPDDIPTAPERIYKEEGWKGFGDWLGTGRFSQKNIRSFKEARNFVHSLGLKNKAEWLQYHKGELSDKSPKPDDIPTVPQSIYKDKGWKGMSDWLGTTFREYRKFHEARDFVHTLGLKSQTEWTRYYKGEMPDKPPKPDDIPAIPRRTYKDTGWNGMGDWLGTGTIATFLREHRPFKKARDFVHTLGLTSGAEWKKYCEGELPDKPPKPDDIPAKPERPYKEEGWKGWGDWLGTGTIATFLREYRPFKKARDFVRRLELKNRAEWTQYCKGELRDKPRKPDDIPNRPAHVYKDAGWNGWGDWLGTGTIAPSLFVEAACSTKPANLPTRLS